MKVTKYVAPVTPFETVFDRLGLSLPTLDRWLGDANGNESWTAVRLPRTNISQTDDAYVFTMEMPGLTREEIEVNLEGDTLVIKGSKETKQDEQGLVRREFHSTKFERTFTVGEGIDREKVRAKMENGILTVTLPKAAAKIGRKIDVA
jgi:HSP20 family protein